MRALPREALRDTLAGLGEPVLATWGGLRDADFACSLCES